MKKDRTTTFKRGESRPGKAGPGPRIEKREQAGVIGDSKLPGGPSISFDRPIPTESKKKDK